MTEDVQKSAKSFLASVGNKSIAFADQIVSPEERQQWTQSAIAFGASNPKLAAFLLTNIILTGFPLGCFIFFTITVTVFTFLTALVLALLGALLFIGVCVGFAFIFFLPIVFFTTALATFIFLWGLAGYYLLRLFSKEDVPATNGYYNENEVNNSTEGRATAASREEQAKLSYNEHTAVVAPHLNGGTHAHA